MRLLLALLLVACATVQTPDRRWAEDMRPSVYLSSDLDPSWAAAWERARLRLEGLGVHGVLPAETPSWELLAMLDGPHATAAVGVVYVLPGASGRGRTSYYPEAGDVRSARVELPDGLDRAHQDAVALHEMLHVLGVQHSCETPDDIMCPRLVLGDVQPATLARLRRTWP